MNLKQIFTQLCHTYCKDQAAIDAFWDEIEKKYTSKKRYYHTLGHINDLINQLSEYKHMVADWDTLLFSVFYHDIVYNVLKHDNEELSADIAAKRLSAIGFPAEKISLCQQQILATKQHQISDQTDTNFLTDADLSILGKSKNEYAQYSLQIRKEYLIFPDLIYKPGRNKVLNHFLSMDRIFKTEEFYHKYEGQARVNLSNELENF